MCSRSDTIHRSQKNRRSAYRYYVRSNERTACWRSIHSRLQKGHASRGEFASTGFDLLIQDIKDLLLALAQDTGFDKAMQALVNESLPMGVASFQLGPEGYSTQDAGMANQSFADLLGYNKAEVAVMVTGPGGWRRYRT